MKKILLVAAVMTLTACTNTANPSRTANNTHTSTPTAESAASGITTSTEVGNRIATDPGYMQCLESARYTCGVNFITGYATNNSDESICDQFSDTNLQNSCREMVITETAKKTLDETRCEALANADKRALCVQDVITTKGVKNQDPTVCSSYVLASTDTDTLENMKDRCVIHIIDQLPPTEKTKGLCGLLINKDLQQNCEQKTQTMIDLIKEQQKHNPNPTPAPETHTPEAPAPATEAHTPEA